MTEGRSEPDENSPGMRALLAYEKERQEQFAVGVDFIPLDVSDLRRAMSQLVSEDNRAAGETREGEPCCRKHQPAAAAKAIVRAASNDPVHGSHPVQDLQLTAGAKGDLDAIGRQIYFFELGRGKMAFHAEAVL
jgi:hypothetical protein